MPAGNRAAHDGHEHERPEGSCAPHETRVSWKIAEGRVPDEDPQRCGRHGEKDHPKAQVVNGLGPAPYRQRSSQVAEEQYGQDPDEFCLGDRPKENGRRVTAADRGEKALDWPQAGEEENTDEGCDHGDQGSGNDTLLPLIGHLTGQNAHEDPDNDTQRNSRVDQGAGNGDGESPETKHQVEVDEDADQRPAPR